MTHVGIDLHKLESQICVIDETGEVLTETRVTTRRDALEKAYAAGGRNLLDVLDANPKGGKIETLTQGFELTIPLYYQGHTYRAGSRIRVMITAPNGDQPIWAFAETSTDPKGKPWVAIAHDKKHPSRLVLPVTPGVDAPTPLPECPAKQALEGLPEGPWIADDRKVVLPPREELHTSMESLIHHFKIVTEGFRVPEGEVYFPIESPRGELGCYVVSDGGPKPWRVKFRAPSFVALQATATCMRDALIADMIAIVGSLDGVMGEVDR